MPRRRVSVGMSSSQGPESIRASPTTAVNTSNNGNNDRMAIMAAVAMTELLGGKSSPTSAFSEHSTPDLANEDSKATAVSTDTSPDRFRVSPSVDRDMLPPSKKARTSESSDESTTPCPSPPLMRMSHDECIKPHASQPRLYHGSFHGSPRSPPPPGFHVVGSIPNGRYNTHFRHHPSSMSPTSVPRTPPPLGHFHQGASMSPNSMYRMHHHHQQQNMTAMRASPTCYEDVTRTSGLPKSLSFRKICSKCGKTRGEHGDFGFGNKCKYQDCGKCGAGEHIHKKKNIPMGILCTLTVEDGAVPGAAANYDRKIQELASRAQLQKDMHKGKQDAVASRVVVAGAP